MYCILYMYIIVVHFILTYMAYSNFLSLKFLFYCSLFFSTCRRELVSKIINFVHLNLCIALLCALIVFIGGIEHAKSIKVLCIYRE